MTISTNFARVALDVVLVVFWVGITMWLRAGRSPAIIAGVLLFLYLGYPLYALIKPAGQFDPAMRAAQGCLFGIVLVLGLMIVLLIAGVRFHRPGLVWTAFVSSMLPVFAVSCGAIVYGINLFLKKPAP